MILIQSLLLKVSLSYRPVNYDPELLTPLPMLENELNMRVPRRLSSATLEHETYWRGSWTDSMELISVDSVKYVYGYICALFHQGLKFFDVYYRRPLLFWQWKYEGHYWWFLVYFSGVFGVLTWCLRDNATYANVIGILGLFIESLLPLPQILLLNRLQSVKNFKVILLLSWLGGDCTKISYLLFGAQNISVIFIIAGLFQMSLDIYIAFQYLKFKYFKEKTSGRYMELEMVDKQSITDVVNSLVSSSDDIDTDISEKTSKGSIGDKIRLSRTQSASTVV